MMEKVVETMAKNIIVLNGAARKNGSTQKLIQSFSKEACSVGHHVREFYLDSMDIHGCKDCFGGHTFPFIQA